MTKKSKEFQLEEEKDESVLVSQRNETDIKTDKLQSFVNKLNRMNVNEIRITITKCWDASGCVCVQVSSSPLISALQNDDDKIE